MNLDLGEILSGQVFAFMIVFTRFAGALMMFPGIGEAFVSPRIRMMFALTFSFMLLPVLVPILPPIPQQTPELVLLVIQEALIGIFFGTVMRLLMDVVATTGSIIGMETGLSNAMILNPSLATQSALPSALLGVAAIVLIFSTGLHELLFRALIDTYKVFPVGGKILFGDMTESFILLISKSFEVGVQLAMPFMVAGLLLYTVMGVMQRTMPQIQLFLVLVPVQIMGGLFIFAMVIGGILAVWLKVYDEAVVSLFIR